MKTPIMAMVFAGALAMPMFAGTALADHDHNLITPGTTVVDIADGQTEKCATDPGGHKFHANGHTSGGQEGSPSHSPTTPSASSRPRARGPTC